MTTPSLDQAHQVVDLLGIVTAVGHGHHDHVAVGSVDAVSDGLGRTGLDVIDQSRGSGSSVVRTSRRREPWCRPASRRRRRSPTGSLTASSSRPSTSSMPGPFVVGRNDDGHTGLHMHHSVTSKVPDVHDRLDRSRSGVDIACGAPITTRSARARTSLERGRGCRRRRRRDRWSTTSGGPDLEDSLQLVGEAGAVVVGLTLEGHAENADGHRVEVGYFAAILETR